MIMIKRHVFIVCLMISVSVALAQPADLPKDSSIQLISPVLGDTFRIGSTLTIRWVVHNQSNPAGGLAVVISPDDGISWIVITPKTIALGDTEFYDDSIGSYSWQIPDSVRFYSNVYLQLASETCLISIGAPYDDSYAASQSKPFRIRPSGTAVMQERRHDGHANRPDGEALLYFGKRISDYSLKGFSLDGRLSLVNRHSPVLIRNQHHK